MAILNHEQKEEIKNTGLFGFITNNGYQFSKQELIELFREFNDAVYNLDKDIEKEAVVRMIEVLEENEEEEDDE